MRKVVLAAIFGLLLSTFWAVPVRGQEFECERMMGWMSPPYKMIMIEMKVLAEINTPEDKLEDLEEEVEIKTRWTSEELNIRKGPGTKYKVVGTLRYNQKVKVQHYNRKWSRLVNDKGKLRGFVRKKYLRKKRMTAKTYSIPEYSGMKSWMDYRKITSPTSPQYRMQQDYAYTGDYGIRMVDGRYCVAIGFAFEPTIGQYFDIVLENGVVIPCVIGDEKSAYDTIDNMFTADTDCCTEFIIDEDCLHSRAAEMGDISAIRDEWDSPVEYIKIYKRNVME